MKAVKGIGIVAGAGCQREGVVRVHRCLVTGA